MKKNHCQAKDPSSCKYHNAQKGVYERMLKNKLLVAKAAYDIAKDTPSRFEAYSSLKQTQEAYYATDSGLKELEYLLEVGTLSSKQNIEVQKLLQKSLIFRVNEETSSQEIVNKILPKPPRKRSSLPSPENAVHISSEHVPLATFLLDNNKSQIDWNSSSGEIVCFPVSNYEKFVIIGKAYSSDEATYKASHWYNEKVTFLEKV